MKRKNSRFPQRWNRYAYTLNNPIRFVDLDGLDVTVAVNAQADVAYAYQHSETFRTEFDKANGNPDVNVKLQKVPTVKGGRAEADLNVTVKETTKDHSTGKESVTRAEVSGTVSVPETRGGPVLGMEAAALFGHELAHVNNLASGKDTAAEAKTHTGPSEDAALATEDDVKDDLDNKNDNIPRSDAVKAVNTPGRKPEEK